VQQTAPAVQFKTCGCITEQNHATAQVVGARRQRFELLLSALPSQLSYENQRCSNERAKPTNIPKMHNCTDFAFAS
jgi:hypothetical protein